MISIVTTYSDIYSNPTITTTIKKLIEKGENIQIIGPVQVLKLENLDNKIIETNINHLYAKISLRPKLFFLFIFSFLRALYSLYKTKSINILAIDPFGLIQANRLNLFKKDLKIHYLSFEILFNEEVRAHDFYRNIKRKEIAYSKKLKSVLIQDYKRKELLVKENHISEENISWHMVPVSPEAMESKRTNYIRNYYKVNKTDKLLLHTGSVARWAGAEMYIEVLERGLPDGQILFIHSKFKLLQTDIVQSKLIEFEKKGYPIILHDSFINNNMDYIKFINNFDYGLAFYIPDNNVITGSNIKEIGLSSGKFAYYMMAGLPTYASDCTIYRQLNEKYNFGVLVKDSIELSKSLKSNSIQYANSFNCKKIFNDHLNSSESIDKFIQCLI